jgi:hypothetical protein
MRYRLTLIAVAGLLLLTAENARAVNLLANGGFEAPPIAGWTITNTVTGHPGLPIEASSLIGFANRQGEIEGQLGFWMRSFAGNIGDYAPATPPPNNVAGNGTLSQTVPGIVGQVYTLKGWSKYEGNFSGAVDELSGASPSGAIPSPTDTTFTLEFLNSGGNVIGSSSLDVKASRVAQSPIFFAGDNAWYEHTLVSPAAPAGTTQVRVSASGTDMLFNEDPQQTGFYDDFSLSRNGAPTTELLTNGNLNTIGQVTEWTLTRSPTQFTGLIQNSSFAAHSGSGGFWLRPFTTIDPIGQALASQVVDGVEGGDYTFSAWSKWEANYLNSDPTDTIIQIEFLDDEGLVIGSPTTLDLQTAGQLADSTWRQFSVNATAPAGTVDVRVTAGANEMRANDVMMGQQQSAFFDDLVLELAAAGLEGDHNGDGAVDAADYVAWRKNPSAFGGDPGGYNDWVANFGAGGGGGGSAVPEPAALVMVFAAAAGCVMTRRRSSCVTN